MTIATEHEYCTCLASQKSKQNKNDSNNKTLHYSWQYGKSLTTTGGDTHSHTYIQIIQQKRLTPKKGLYGSFFF